MEYKQIKSRKIYEQVAEAILDMIRKGELNPGDKLDSVQQLAENFQVGRAAIREALSALRAMGIVEMKQGEGTFVREFDPMSFTLPLSTAALMNMNDINHLLEVRKILEVGAAFVAATKRTEQDLLAMEYALNEMKNNIDNEELGEKADWLFHLAVASASQNPILVSLMNNVSGMMVEAMKETRKIWLYSNQATADRLYQEHEEIYNAIRAKEPEKAQQLMLNHISSVENVLKSFHRTNK
ncbi:FadR/GntR family transcriptional regulator [Bacillus kexueae]|uniref:FadR/GntR family transcriptional regulator n=1 Tax=Aeribacillus kexueae TaxID=2078952 RepID=UPI0024359A8C|nr:FadR/GntR family transcriptional regulator [Bacillus kexueae]